ncbi:hypothetical protein HKCCE3408_07315 [Rhodobacterales bacterium HKCCE3408]|nr:hypothetical protein [Rhodobacterales bacterium HKCCE3408]
MIRYLAPGLLALVCATSAGANPVSQACLASGRSAATFELCACVGAAASLTLSDRDQRQAAQLFTDPQRAQEISQSSRNRDASFWERYTVFTRVAEDMCG